jgi:hypothetical protein
MKDAFSIHEDELDGALNALFLETIAGKEDEQISSFIWKQEYSAVISKDKEALLLARLAANNSGGKFLWILFSILLILSPLIIFLPGEGKNDRPVSSVQKNDVTENSAEPALSSNPVVTETNAVAEQEQSPRIVSADKLRGIQSLPAVLPHIETPLPYTEEAKPEPNTEEEKELPYFNKAGLAFFSQVKEQLLQKVVKIDDALYGKTEPGSTFYKSREILVDPFVMANFPVTNLEYKTFLADLAMQGRMDDLKKALPKSDTWKDYGCLTLAKNYFESEAYNDFPVVNISREATAVFCEWLEAEVNTKLSELVPKKSKFNSAQASAQKAKQVIVRLPYDYEWIYSADAGVALIPDCPGYNTIYDPGEGLVDGGFYKRTSQLSKHAKKGLTRMDELMDVNRFGMTEAEILAIYKEAIEYKGGKARTNSFDPSAPPVYPGNVEACCLAGHVCELIKDKEGGMTVRGNCWSSKAEYLKMMDSFKKNNASPFIGFRVVIVNAEKGTYKNPFW